MLWAPSPSSKCTRHCNWQNLANMPPSTPLVPVLNELGITTDNILRVWHCTASSVVQEMASTSAEAPAAYSVSCSKRLAYLFGWDRVSWFSLAIHSTPFRLSLGWEKWKLRQQQHLPAVVLNLNSPLMWAGLRHHILLRGQRLLWV